MVATIFLTAYMLSKKKLIVFFCYWIGNKN